MNIDNGKDAYPEMPRRTSVLKRWSPIVTIVAAAMIVYANGWHSYLSLSNVAEHREFLQNYVQTNLLTSLFIYAMVYVAIVAFSLPGGAAATITGGFLFGWLLSGSVTVFAATLGATILFLAARTSLGSALRDKAGGSLRKIADGFKEDALSYLLFLRLVPIFPFWLVNLAPALLGVPLGTYVFATFIGIIPGTFAFAFFGSGLGSVIDAQTAANEACIAEKGIEACPFSIHPGSLVTKELLLAIGAMGVVAILPVVLKKMRRRTAT